MPTTSTTAAAASTTVAPEPVSLGIGGAFATTPPANLDVELQRPDGSTILRRIDLATGSVQPIGPLATSGAMESAPGGSVVVDDGVVSYVDGNGFSQRIGEGDDIQAGPDRGQIWIYGRGPDGRASVQLINLLTRVVERRLEVPAGSVALVAGGANPVVDTGGQGAFRLDASTGTPTRITTGVLQSYRDGWFTDLTCDDHLACVITLHGPKFADRVIADGAAAPSTTSTVGPNGKTVVLAHRARAYLAPSYEIYDVAAGATVDRLLIASPITARPRWSADGSWLFLASSDTIAVLPGRGQAVLIRLVALGRLASFTLTG